MKKVENYITYFILIMTGGILRIFPLYIVRKLAVFTGFFFYLIPIRKKVLYKNLKLCFPDKDEKWYKQIAKNSYKNVCLVLFEVLYLPRISAEKLKEMVSGDVSEFVNAYGKNKGVSVISGHISNWEISASAAKVNSGIKLFCIARPQTNSLVNKKINQYREKFGNVVIETGANLRHIYQKVKEKEAVAFIIDQSAPAEYSYFVDFFGVDVASYSGAAKIALKYDTEVVFSVIVRKKNLNYSYIFINIQKDDLTGTFDEKAKELTARMNKTLENIIRQYPEQWLWFHRRFKNIRLNENENTYNTDSIYR